MNGTILKSLLRTSSLAAAALALGYARDSSASLVVDFNTPGQLTNYFASTAGNPIVQSTSGGLANSGSVSFSNLTGDVQYLVLKTPFAGNLASWNVSVFGKTAASNPGSVISYMGIVPSLAVYDKEGSPSNNGTTYAPSLYFSSGDAGVGSFSYNGVDDPSGAAIAYTQALAASTWYRNDFEVTYLGANTYNVTSRVYRVDANGGSATLIGQDVSKTFVNAVLAADPSVYLYIGMYQGAALDSFSTTAVIPEASTATLLAACGSLLLSRRRRSGPHW